MAYNGTVHAEVLADCPFSVAGDYAREYLAGGERTTAGTLLRAGPLERPVTLRYASHVDESEPGRPHDEIVLRWTAGSGWLPDFAGTLRMRIDDTRTRLILDGSYRPPGGPLGVLFDVFIGRRIAGATVNELLHRIAHVLESRERQWRAQVENRSQPTGN